MDLQEIPGVGKSIEKDFNSLGIYKISDLKNRNPEKLFDDLCKNTGANVDRCVLYVFRCAVYYSKTPNKNPHLLKWWNWKDKTI
jgi:hypothetical protein